MIILDKYSYSSLFDNLFSPHLQVLSFNWNINQDVSRITEINTNINTEFAEKLQNKAEYSERETKLSVVDKTDLSFELKDITPKRKLFRRL